MAVENSRLLSIEYPEMRVLIDPGKEMWIGSSEGSGLIHRLEKGRCRREEWGVSIDPRVDMCIGSFGGSGTINRVEYGRNSRIEWSKGGLPWDMAVENSSLLSMKYPELGFMDSFQFIRNSGHASVWSKGFE
ncbi:hypothetical protein QAD02_000897 [Eretmocerus hayati]|uniref:Uncharacterized protein n=1 Tax=Eretmocerus hayati TaxID=131215 RepID=A0ACC2NEQ0_9HYME|nr:hypothetical protein QAD02_000897 [Eretmocerus hayati]